MSTVPTYADAIAALPECNIFPYGIDTPRNLVSRRTRILQPSEWPVPFFHNRVTMTDAAGLDLYANLSARRLRDGTFDNFEVCSGAWDLDGFHRAWHVFLGQ
jgi:hypothetical protein